MNNENNMRRLYARWFNEVMYLLIEYYEKATSKEDKQNLLFYKWGTLLPRDDLRNNNSFINKVYLDLYENMEKEEYKKIHRFFRKRKIFQIIKKLKRKVLW